MVQLTNEDYDFFDDYLAVTNNSIEDSDNNVGLKDDQASIKAIKRNSGQSLKKRNTCTLNQETLETQDKSSDIAVIMGRHSSDASEQDINKLGTVLRPPAQIYTNTPQTDKYHLTKEFWSTMEYMEPNLQMFDQACNVFQRKAPSKHLVLPYYQVILNHLTHYASKIPHSWRRACEAAHGKLKKYYNFEMANNDSLIAMLLNPKYHEGIFNQMGFPTH
ncbi:hypothetical protein O181_024275 [Austropuccinia psidii MF-1]|uniref:Uncharacterized protein n=1 Tax=Austropuccinia psidii MF-1 TaxID=1389203 RepID=A0A9Q3CKN9_9BASI|nr:hypothetical protein [Austropuccinia psidii MF-1]